MNNTIFKNLFFFLIIIIVAITTNVNAESKYLYDVLKNEAESNGLAREYTGEHHDSFTEEPSKKIYHWYAENDNEGNQVLNKNNVIFGNFCWQMIRTTDTGGVKLIYNGEVVNNKCISQNDRTIGANVYNSSNSKSLSAVGYMYNRNYSYYSTENVSNYLYSNTVSYRNGKYYLDENAKALTTEYIIPDHHYTCWNTTGECTTVSYVYAVWKYRKFFYIKLSNGETIFTALENMLYSNDVNKYDSSVKSKIDTWYQNNLTNYGDYLEDTIFCNNRKATDLGFWGETSSGYNNGLVFYEEKDNKLKCYYDTDKFSISNPKAKLKYPIALPTKGELDLLNNKIIREATNYTSYWTMSPYGTGNEGGLVTYNQYGSFNSMFTMYSEHVKPSVSLKPYTKYYRNGDGSSENPYIVKYKESYYKIKVENDSLLGTIKISEDDLSSVLEEKEINVVVKPSYGYYLKKIVIKDSNNNIIEYIKTGNENEYSFIMPDSDIIITPIYEKVKSSVNVEIVNETKDLNVEIEDLTQVEYEKEVKFNVTPIKGYKVSSIRVVDGEDNEIEYSETENKNEYVFIMPASNVTIIPSYEKVSSSVSASDNKNTKELKIEVGDATAVIYEDKVKFTVTPEDGYEVESIEIKDKEGNKIEYRKTDKDNEYEFTMPDTDVVITPVYRKKELTNNITNPKTGNKTIILITILFLIVSTTYIIVRKKKEFS